MYLDRQTPLARALFPRTQRCPVLFPLLPLLALSCSFTLNAQQQAPAKTATTSEEEQLERLVVSVQQQAKPWLSSVAAVSRLELDASPALDIAALLKQMPGLQADQRANFAQDSRISLRGFGSRSSFGVRGIEVLFDGIPWSTSDGQSQPSSIPFEQLSAVEVLRGPFAALYGNAAGGVLTLQSNAPIAGASVQSQQSSDYRQHSLQAGDGQTELYLKTLDHDGYRAHNSAKKRQAALRSSYQFDSVALNFRYDWSDDPLLEDPLGLTKAEFERDPNQTAAVATLFNSRKSSAQRQLSMTLSPDDDNWQVSAWQGERDITQFLSFSGDGPTAAGGVVALTRHYRGLKAQQLLQWNNWQHQFVAQLEENTDQRQGYVNLRGIAGDLRRDESGKVQNSEIAWQSEYQTDLLWALHLGSRLSRIKFKVEDYFIRPGNPDDGGQSSEQLAAFALGASYPLTEQLHFYVSSGRGFETPTLTEMAYQPNGSGLNLALKPARNRQLDLGLKWLQQHTQASLDWFYIQSRDELVVAQSLGGRTSYRNAAKTQRTGAEVWLLHRFSEKLELQWSSTLLDASFKADSSAGNNLPGVARVQHQLGLSYAPFASPFWQLSSQLSYRGKLWIDDNNSMAADSATLWDLKSSWQTGWRQTNWSWWLAIDNLTNQDYAGAVVVNQANGRSFEPGTPRQFQLGFRVQLLTD